MEKEGNGIVSLENMFTITPEGPVYNREDDIIPTSKSEVNKQTDDNKGGEGDKEPDLGNNGGEGAAGGEGENPASGEEGNQTPSGTEDEKKALYIDVLKALSNKGIIPPLEEIIFSDGKDGEVNVVDMPIPDSDTFGNILASVMDIQKQELMQNKIDVTSVSELTRKLIEAEKQGVNIVEILKQYDKTNAPLENLNMDEKKDQLKVIRAYINSLNLPKDESEEFYNSIVERGDDYIEAKALRYKTELDKQMDTLIQERTRAAKEQREKDAEELRRFKKELKASIQSKYQLNESMVTKVMDFLFKPSKTNPNFSEANERVKSMLTNPESAPDLLMFLMNPEEFIKQKSNKALMKENKRIYTMISTTTKDRRTAPVDNRGHDVNGKEFEEIELKSNI